MQAGTGVSQVVDAVLESDQLEEWNLEEVHWNIEL